MSRSLTRAGQTRPVVLGRVILPIVAGLLALHDLHLVDLQLAGERAELRLPRMQKTAPESSAVFRRALFLQAQASSSTYSPSP